MTEFTLGEIKVFPFDFAPSGWASCNGQILPKNQHSSLFALIGTTYGGDGITTFALPDLRNRTVLHRGNGHNVGNAGGEVFHKLTIAEIPPHRHVAVASSLNKNTNTVEGSFWPADRVYNKTNNTKLHPLAMGKAGGDQGHENMAPYLSLNFCICLDGKFNPSHDDDYIGAIRLMPHGKPVDDSARMLPCDGQELSITQYTSLFSVIRNTYGGQENKTFRLPDLRGKAPIQNGQGEGLTHYDIGETAGVEKVKLSEAQMATHRHAPMAKQDASVPNANDTVTWANGLGRPAPNGLANAKGTGQQMNPGTLADEGGGGEHNNMMPYNTMTYYICWDGTFPNRG